MPGFSLHSGCAARKNGRASTMPGFSLRLLLELSLFQTYILAVCGFAVQTKETMEQRGWFDDQLGVCATGCVHGTRGWFAATCECNTGWTNVCCDRPTTCTTSMDVLCPRDMLELKSAHTSAFATGKSTPMRIGTAPLPLQARGVFWLRDQGDSSSLMSFAKSNDGDGVSPGVIPDDGKYKIRVTGDRTWSFADESFNWEASQEMDLIYTFKFDNATDPKSARVVAGGGSALSVVWKVVTLAIEFALELVETEHPRYKSSIVWDRPSRDIIFGYELSTYQAVQVMDEHGNKLEPAFSDWVEYNKQNETGNTPDTIFYFEAK